MILAASELFVWFFDFKYSIRVWLSYSFGPLLQLEQKQKYAAWKAADIRKALKEGRKPVPGPPVDENDLSLPKSTSSGAYV